MTAAPVREKDCRPVVFVAGTWKLRQMQIVGSRVAGLVWACVRAWRRCWEQVAQLAAAQLFSVQCILKSVHPKPLFSSTPARGWRVRSWQTAALDSADGLIVAPVDVWPGLATEACSADEPCTHPVPGELARRPVLLFAFVLSPIPSPPSALHFGWVQCARPDAARPPAAAF
jgi:hypothetical protein